MIKITSSLLYPHNRVPKQTELRRKASEGRANRRIDVGAIRLLFCFVTPSFFVPYETFSEKMYNG